MTQAEGTRLIAVIQAAFPRYAITDATRAIYCELIADLDYSTTKAALARLLATSKWPPTIAEIREAVAGAKVGADKGDAEQAWLEVRDRVKRVGYYGTPLWSNPLIGEVIRAFGGWQEFCQCTTEQSILRPQFVKFYDGLRARAVQQANVGVLPPPVVQRPALAVVPRAALPDPVDHASVRQTLSEVLRRVSDGLPDENATAGLPARSDDEGA